MQASNKGRLAGEGLPSKFKRKILECFGYTTAHGYGRVAAASESQPRRWFWLLVCAVAYGIFGYQFHDLTVQFLARPLKTRTWIAREQVIYDFQLRTKHENCRLRNQVTSSIKINLNLNLESVLSLALSFRLL